MDFCGIIYEILPFSGNILNILIMSGVCIGIQSLIKTKPFITMT